MILGLDISTSCTGYTVMSESGELMEMGHISMKSLYKNVESEHRYLLKAGNFRDKIVEIMGKYNQLAIKFSDDSYMIKSVWVEKPFVRFGASSSANTISSLIEFNGICRYILNELFGFPPYTVTVHDARSSFLPEFVRVEYENVENPELLDFIEEEKIEFPSKMKLFKDKCGFIKGLYPDLNIPFKVKLEKKVFSYNMDIDIKHYIFEKVLRENPKISPIKNKKGKIDSINYDMTDSYVISYYGYKQNLNGKV